eukprot:SAG11_NODE_129_length_15500_cov_16.145250_2_plen_113_part_00
MIVRTTGWTLLRHLDPCAEPAAAAGAGAGVTFAVGLVTEHFANQATNGGDSLEYGMAKTFEFVPPGYAIGPRRATHAAPHRVEVLAALVVTVAGRTQRRSWWRPRSAARQAR